MIQPPYGRNSGPQWPHNHERREAVSNFRRPVRLDAGGSFFFGLGVAEEESSNQRESLSAYKGFDDR